MKTYNATSFKRLRLVLMSLFFLLSALDAAYAQPVLNFKRIVNRWPATELYFSVTCGGKHMGISDKRHLTVSENGIPINDFDLWCADTTFRCAISVALVFDASGSMIGAGNAGAKAAGLAFTDMMDGVNDEACVVWFSSSVTMAQHMTRYKDLLQNAINALPANGGTAMWDGVFNGLMNVVNDGTNPCRAVVLLTDGGDNASTRSPDEVISLAQRNKIRIFTIGLGTGLPTAVLQNIAELTGGRFYETPDPAQLTAIYKSIAAIIFQSFRECLITYDSKCPDGEQRRVDLGAVDLCGGADAKTKSFIAPLDTSAHTPLRIRLGRATIPGGREVKLPLELMDPVDKEVFHTSTFRVSFDESCVRFKEIRTPAGSLLEGIPISASPAPGAVNFVISGRRALDVQTVPAMLAELTFVAVNPTGRDTACCAVELTGWAFGAGCFRPVTSDGEICVVAIKPELACALNAPDTVAWNEARQEYVPQTILVSSQVSNTGLDTARNPRFKIDFDAADYVLVSPATDSVQGNPAGLAPGANATPTWELRPGVRAAGGMRPVSITAYSDNHPPSRCAKNIFVADAEPFLECSINMPVVTADDSAGKYEPMPIPVSVTLTNRGSVTSATARARLQLPQGLEFATPDSPASAEKIATQANIGPGQQAQVAWLIRHDISTVEKSYQVGVTAINGSVENGVCSAALRIPRLLPPLRLVIAADGPLEFCEGDSVILDAGADYYSSLWSTGAATRSITVTTSGKYSVTVTDSAQRSAVSPEVIVTVYPRPMPVITANGPLSFCDGDSVTLDAGAGFAAYLWNDGSTKQTLTVASSGLWHANVWNAEGCVGVSDTVATIAHPNPPVPVIQRQGDALSTQTAHSYQWHLDGTPLPGDTGRTLAASQTGIYTVTVFNEFGCSSISDPFDVTTLSAPAAAEAPKWGFDVFPDPASNRVTVRLRSEKGGHSTIILYDAVGRMIMSRNLKTSGTEATTAIDVRPLTPGIYHVVVMHEGAARAKKFVKAP